MLRKRRRRLTSSPGLTNSSPLSRKGSSISNRFPKYNGRRGTSHPPPEIGRDEWIRHRFPAGAALILPSIANFAMIARSQNILQGACPSEPIEAKGQPPESFHVLESALPTAGYVSGLGVRLLTHHSNAEHVSPAGLARVRGSRGSSIDRVASPRPQTSWDACGTFGLPSRSACGHECSRYWASSRSVVSGGSARASPPSVRWMKSKNSRL